MNFNKPDVNRIQRLRDTYFPLANIETMDIVMRSIGLSAPTKPQSQPPTLPEDITALTHVQLSNLMAQYQAWAEFLSVTEGINESERIALETYYNRYKAEEIKDKSGAGLSRKAATEWVSESAASLDLEELVGYIKSMKARLKVYKDAYVKAREVLSRELTRRCQLNT